MASAASWIDLAKSLFRLDIHLQTPRGRTRQAHGRRRTEVENHVE